MTWFSSQSATSFISVLSNLHPIRSFSTFQFFFVLLVVAANFFNERKTFCSFNLNVYLISFHPAIYSFHSLARSDFWAFFFVRSLSNICFLIVLLIHGARLFLFLIDLRARRVFV